MTHTLRIHMINIFIIIPVPALILSAGVAAERNGEMLENIRKETEEHGRAATNQDRKKTKTAIW